MRVGHERRFASDSILLVLFQTKLRAREIIIKPFLRCCRGGNRCGVIGDVTATRGGLSRAHGHAAARTVGSGAPAHPAHGGVGDGAAARGAQASRAAAGASPPRARSRPPPPPRQHRHRLRGRGPRNGAPLHPQRHGAPPTHRPQKPLRRTQKADTGDQGQGARSQSRHPTRGRVPLPQTARGRDYAGEPQETAKQTPREIEKAPRARRRALPPVLRAAPPRR